MLRPVKKELLDRTYIDPCVTTPASVLTFNSNRSDVRSEVGSTKCTCPVATSVPGKRVNRHMIGGQAKRTLSDHHRPVRLVHIVILKLIDSFRRDGEGLIRR